MKSNPPLPPSPLLFPSLCAASIALPARGISSSVTNDTTCGLVFSFFAIKEEVTWTSQERFNRSAPLAGGSRIFSIVY